MLKKSAAIIAIAAAMAVGGTGAALAGNGADDPAGHHQGQHHHNGKHHHHGRHHHHKGDDHGGHGGNDGAGHE